MSTSGIAILLFFLSISLSYGQYDVIRLCTYNLDGFDASQTDSQHFEDLKLVLKTACPRLLVIQGIQGRAGFERLHVIVREVFKDHLDSATFYIDSESDTQFALWYDPRDFRFREVIGIPTAPRHCGMYHFGRTEPSLNGTFRETSFYVITGDLNPGKNDSDIAVRRAAGKLLYDAIDTHIWRTQRDPRNAMFVVAGTLNAYSNEDPAYSELATWRINSKYLFHPVDRMEAWTGDTTYPWVYTSSSRAEDGGIRERLDVILMNGWYQVWNSYRVLGNDSAHYGKPVTALPNTMVTDSVALALEHVSRHLPVYVDLKFITNKPLSVENTTPWKGSILNLW
ncbi:MAG: hypothetical protein AB7H80_02950 [Candidatus Kapaibacterium sp.]